MLENLAGQGLELFQVSQRHVAGWLYCGGDRNQGEENLCDSCADKSAALSGQLVPDVCNLPKLIQKKAIHKFWPAS